MPRWVGHSLASLVFSAAPRVADVLAFVVISRISGASEAAVFSVAAAYLAIFAATTRGLDDLLIRQVAGGAADNSQAVGGFLSIKLLVATGSIVLVVGVLSALHYPSATARAVMVIALGFIPEVLASSVYAYFQGRRSFGFPAIALSGVAAARLICAVVLALRGGTAYQVAVAWSVMSLVWAVLAELAYMAESGRYLLPCLARGAILEWRAGVTFLSITTLLALESYLDVIILERVHAAMQVTWYRAATNVVFSVALVAQAYQAGVYPYMARLGRTAEDELRSVYHSSMSVLVCLVFPAIAGVAILAPDIIALVFGEGFDAATPVLRILAVALVFIFLNAPVSRVLLVYQRQASLLVVIVVTLVVNIIGNFVLGQTMGAIGAAISRVASSLCFFALSLSLVSRLMGPPRIGKAARNSGVATLLMGLVLWRIAGSAVLWQVVMGLIAYVVAYFFLSSLAPDNGLGRLVTALLGRPLRQPDAVSRRRGS